MTALLLALLAQVARHDVVDCRRSDLRLETLCVMQALQSGERVISRAFCKSSGKEVALTVWRDADGRLRGAVNESCE